MSHFMTAQEVASACMVSKGKAYEIIKELNSELKAKGYLTITGKVPTKYFNEKIYGLDEKQGNEDNPHSENNLPNLPES